MKMVRKNAENHSVLKREIEVEEDREIEQRCAREDEARGGGGGGGR